jgi:hypothetical protein
MYDHVISTWELGYYEMSETANVNQYFECKVIIDNNNKTNCENKMS